MGRVRVGHHHGAAQGCQLRDHPIVIQAGQLGMGLAAGCERRGAPEARIGQWRAGRGGGTHREERCAEHGRGSHHVLRASPKLRLHFLRSRRGSDQHTGHWQQAGKSACLQRGHKQHGKVRAAACQLQMLCASLHHTGQQLHLKQEPAQRLGAQGGCQQGRAGGRTLGSRRTGVACGNATASRAPGAAMLHCRLMPSYSTRPPMARSVLRRGSTVREWR